MQDCWGAVETTPIIPDSVYDKGAEAAHAFLREQEGGSALFTEVVDHVMKTVHCGEQTAVVAVGSLYQEGGPADYSASGRVTLK